MKAFLAVAALTVLGIQNFNSEARAAESAAGAYILGLRGPGMGVTPPPGIFFSHQLYLYRGDIAGRLPTPGGLAPSAGRVRAAVAIPTFVFVTPLEIFGGRLGATLTTPYGRVNVAGRIGPFRLKDSATTFADPSVGAFLGWRRDNIHWQVGVTGFLPIGDYQRGALANVAKHRGALDVFASLTWIEPHLGLDVSTAVGVTFNRANAATRYRTGTELHWDWAITKKFDNGFTIGPAGYFYRQLTADSGPGAILGDFRGEVWALGGGIGYEFKIGPAPVTARLRYFREVHVRNRLKGETIFFGVSFPIWVPGQRG